MRHFFQLSSLVLALTTVAFIPQHGNARELGALELGATAPQLHGKKAIGGTFDAVELRSRSGHSALVVAFIDFEGRSTSRELNELRRLDVEWGRLGVHVVVVGKGNSPKLVKKYVRRNAIGWPVLADPEGKRAADFGAETTPYAVVVDASGIVRHVARGDAMRHRKIRKVLASVTGREMPWGERGRRSTMLSYDAKYRFGRPPSGGGASVRWQPLAMHMGRVANVYIAMWSGDNYNDYEKLLLAGEFEIANAGPVIGQKILENYEPVVSFERRGKDTYRGIFFARSSSGITSLKQLRGKTLALVAPRSTSGGAYPVAELLKAGLVLEDGVRLYWAESHTRVAEAVRDGVADAGACYDDCREAVWPSVEIRDAETHIIGFTDDIPTEMVFFRRDLPEGKKDRLRAALLSVGALELIARHISRGETPISGVVDADPKVLARVKKALAGVPEALAVAKTKAAVRDLEERRQRGGL